MGELGLGATARDRNVKRPRLNPHLHDIVTLAVGGMHVAAVDVQGRIWTWGVNDHGSLGRDTKVDTSAKTESNEEDEEDEEEEEEEDEDELLNALESQPGLVEGFPKGIKALSVACGDSISIATADDGKVYSWGTFRVHHHPSHLQN